MPKILPVVTELMVVFTVDKINKDKTSLGWNKCLSMQCERYSLKTICYIFLNELQVFFSNMIFFKGPKFIRNIKVYVISPKIKCLQVHIRKNSYICVYIPLQYIPD